MIMEKRIVNITSENFGKLQDSSQVERYWLNGDKLHVAILSYGATLQKIEFEGKDLILGYDTINGYLNGRSYQGASIGRYANRIAAGKFNLNGKEYDLGCNENGAGHLHGGFVGFDKKLWKGEIVTESEEPTIRFSQVSADGEEGYPGTFQESVTYTVTKDDTLRMAYEAVSDKDTVINLTNHAYFNLNGWDGGDVLDVELQVFADEITQINEKFIPTGKLLSVDNTPFDFRKPKAIGRDIENEDVQLKLGLGYDHNFVLGMSRAWRHAVSAYSPKSGIRMDCHTDLPGVQVYTSNMLGEKGGKGNKALYKHQGFCLETQLFPDTPNYSNFPSAILKAGKRWKSVTEYHFSK